MINANIVDMYVPFQIVGDGYAITRTAGWSGGAIVLGKLPVPGRPTNRPFSHCLCACVYRSRGALFLDNRRDFTEMGQTDFKRLILSM